MTVYDVSPKSPAAPRTIRTIPAKPKSRKHLRVAAYCRVSKDSDGLKHSFNAQVNYYKEKILRNPSWTFASIYADYGITGVTSSRPQFQKLIGDCEQGKIDLILCKSISRFARNTVDTLKTLRRLKELNIAVYFERENINSLSADGELMITLLASYAQEESESISKNVRWAVQKKYEQGIAFCHTKVLGYDWEEGELVVNEAEAEVVRLIFEAFSSGTPLGQICRELNESGHRTSRGNQFDGEAVKRILRNDVYIGNLTLQKNFMKEHKEYRNQGELPIFQVEEDHPALVSKEIFDFCQERLSTPSPSEEWIRCPSPWRGKLYCSICGSRYYPVKKNIRQTRQPDAVRLPRYYWLCSKRKKESQGC